MSTLVGNGEAECKLARLVCFRPRVILSKMGVMACVRSRSRIAASRAVCTHTYTKHVFTVNLYFATLIVFVSGLIFIVGREDCKTEIQGYDKICKKAQGWV